MTATAIRNVALKYLAAYDYDAFSMNQIANEVGIKKASIYAHYRSKEEIFYAVLTEALHDGKQKIVRFFLEQRDQPLDETLHAFFRWFVKESEDHLQLKFLLRMLYFPPSHLKSYESSQYTGALLVSFEKLLARYIREKKRTDHFRLLQSEADVSIAFLTVVEGCFIELFFGDVRRFERRVQAILPLFLNGMRK